DLTALPFASASVDGALCWYALIHLDAVGRAAAYREIARVTRPGAPILLAFHTSDFDTPAGGAKNLTRWWDQPVELTFRFLDPATETQAAGTAGLDLLARLDREPYGHEHPSRRSYLLLRNDAR
ncbi:MAG: class I SAM-dependent methyltransferase, partial [Acidimicrobiales bacterium]